MNNESQSDNTKLESTSPLKSVTKDWKRIGTLRRRLLISVLPVVLIPLAFASTLGYTITERRVTDRALEQLDIHAIEASTIISVFIENSFKAIDLVAANPEVIEAMKAGAEKTLEQRLDWRSIADLEKQYADIKLLTINDRLNNYLQELVKGGQFAEIFMTESHGFNVAYSNPTSDFVQRDESWWKISEENGIAMDEPEFDESANANVIPFSKAIKDPKTGKFLGVIKAAVPIELLTTNISSQFSGERYQYSILQIIDPDESFILYHNEKGEVQSLENMFDDDDELEHHEALEEDDDDETHFGHTNVIGGKPIIETIEILVRVEGNSLSFEALEESENEFWKLEEARELIAQKEGFSEVNLRQEKIFSETITLASFRYQDNLYTVSTIPSTDFVSIEVIDYHLVTNEARQMLMIFAISTLFLGTIAIGLIILLAKQLSQPLINLSTVTQQVASGDLDVTANVEGTLETQTLADNFNQLVDRVKNSLQEQTNLADEQLKEKEQLETAIFTLLTEVSDATEGDLTVRANLDNLELSTVADLFNAIISNLHDIAIETRESSSQVGNSLKENESAIRFLAQQALEEARETRNTLLSVEQMSESIQTVAENANQAEQIVDDTYSTVLSSTENMDLTVNSILNLKNTVGETAKKMKRLGESSQRISQVVSLIEEIALKTNVLAINASAEADRAGEYGQGFAVVAAQVGTLAKQCTAATKEITKVVTQIQGETEEVSREMVSGNAQVIETTNLVESTKESLGLILQKSQVINQLMESIAESTISQASTSQNVTNLMQKIANLSETTSKSSQEVAQSIVDTARVAAKLESTVAQFKVADS